jgi:hypothetical protein
MTRKILETSGKEAAEEFTKKSMKQTLMPVIKRYWGITGEEGLEEAATQLYQNTLDKYTGYRPEIDILDGVAESFLVGISAGALYSSPVAALNVMKMPNNKNQAENVYIPNIPVQESFRLGVIIMDYAMEVYINGYLMLNIIRKIEVGWIDN